MPRRSSTAGGLTVGGLSVLAVLGGLLFLFGWDAHLGIAHFERIASTPQVAGKTPAQIVALLGTPDAQADYGHGRLDLVFFGPHGAVCRIEFNGGFAVRSVIWTS